MVRERRGRGGAAAEEAGCQAMVGACFAVAVWVGRCSGGEKVVVAVARLLFTLTVSLSRGPQVKVHTRLCGANDPVGLCAATLPATLHRRGRRGDWTRRGVVLVVPWARGGAASGTMLVEQIVTTVIANAQMRTKHGNAQIAFLTVLYLFLH
jgi:hypothetical protein